MLSGLIKNKVLPKTSSTSTYFTEDQLQQLMHGRIPQHIAIIPDGNRRWAKKVGCNTLQGHQKGADNLLTIVKAAKELGIPIITFYVFSTENWNRDSLEIKGLMWLLESYLIEQKNNMIDIGVRFQTIGNTQRFSERIQDTIQKTKDATAHCDSIDMVMALNYGSRDEITRALKAILSDIETKKLTKESVNEKMIANYLDTNHWPDPDILIRTSGERRQSNFLLWQSSYSEIYLSNVLWPDFSPEHLLEAVIDFQQRDRRLGG